MSHEPDRLSVALTHVRKILVVDDNEDGAAMLSEALRAHGHETRVAHDAPAALHITESAAATWHDEREPQTASCFVPPRRERRGDTVESGG